MNKFVIIIIFTALLLTFRSFAQQSTCDYKVEVLVNGEEFSIENFTWRMKATKIEGTPTNITGTAKIENSDGKTVKSYKPWTNDSISKQKTSGEYSPNLKLGEYDIVSEINVECYDTDKSNNIDIKKIKIKDAKEEIKAQAASNTNNNTYQEIKNTAITITDAKNDSISKEESKPINENNTKTIQNKTPETGTENEEFDNVVQLKVQNKKDEKLQPTAAVVQKPQVVYESSNEKSKSLILIFLLALSILLNIILIWKR